MKNLKNINSFLNEAVIEENQILEILKNAYKQYNLKTFGGGSINNYAVSNPGIGKKIGRNDNLDFNGTRILGFMEALLICLEILTPGEKFDYQVKKRKFLGLIPYSSKEKYSEIIIRKVEEYLEGN